MINLQEVSEKIGQLEKESKRIKSLEIENAKLKDSIEEMKRPYYVFDGRADPGEVLCICRVCSNVLGPNYKELRNQKMKG